MWNSEIKCNKLFEIRIVNLALRNTVVYTRIKPPGKFGRCIEFSSPTHIRVDYDGTHEIELIDNVLFILKDTVFRLSLIHI